MNAAQSKVLHLAAAIVSRATVGIVYRDRSGVVSLRRVQVHAIHCCQNGQTCVLVFDLDRKAPRTFRLTGILSVDPVAVGAVRLLTDDSTVTA